MAQNWHPQVAQNTAEGGERCRNIHVNYPVNYGYVEGIMAPDGEEQDAYILGVYTAVNEFAGKVIAVIHRDDDAEEKWVVAPAGMTFSKDEIMEQVRFQEQYFKSRIIIS